MKVTQNDEASEYVRAKVRRIVGYAALRRASRIVRDWQIEEREKQQFARRTLVVLLLLTLFGAIPFAARFLHN